MNTTSTDLKFTTWEQAAAWTVERFHTVAPGNLDPISYANAVDDMLAVGDFSFADVAWEGFAGFKATTSGGEVDDAALVELLASKQRDYGHDNILRYGIDGVKVRISDKVCRLKNLLGRGIDASNEAIEDSWLDIIGYSVIGSMLEDGTFELPLSADATVVAPPPRFKAGAPAVVSAYRIFNPEVVEIEIDGVWAYQIFDGEPF